jgi:hypothetical protein
VQRLKELEKENARLKKLLSERDLEVDCLKEVASKIGRRSPEESGGAAPGPEGDVFPTPSLPLRKPVSLDGAVSAAASRR